LGFLALSDVSNREDVVKLKTLAVRRGLWFKALSALERATVDLTIRVVEKVRSPTLKSVLRSIAFKVIEALKSRSFKERAVAIGQALVRGSFAWLRGSVARGLRSGLGTSASSCTWASAGSTPLRCSDPL